MSSPDKSSTKPKLSKKILEDDHVFFYHGVHETSGWLRPIQTQIRQLRTRFPYELKARFDDALDKFKCSRQDAGEALEDGWSLSPPAGAKGYRATQCFDEDN